MDTNKIKFLSWLIYFLLKILKTAYHSARPRFYSNNHNTSMFITLPIYCTSFICVGYVTNSLLLLCICQSSLYEEKSSLLQHTDTRSVRAYQHSHSILQWCHPGGELMDGAITGEPGFLFEGAQITCNDVFKHFWNEALFMEQRYRKMEDQKPWPGLARN